VSVLATRKLLSYTALAATGLIIAVLAGDADLAILAAPFAVLVAFAVGSATRPRISISVLPERDRVLSGDLISTQIKLQTDAPRTVELTATPQPGLQINQDGSNRVRLRPGQDNSLSLQVRCQRWGRYDLGAIGVRATGPFGLFVYQGRATDECELRVYPRPEHVTAALPPRDTQALVGDFVSRAKSDGHEFADIREYRPGDRVKRINWPVTARRGTLHVNEYHPERNADLILFLDTYADLTTGTVTSLERVVAAAAALADYHLRRRDRIGLVCYGGTLQWLTPAAGLHHFYRIIEALLDVRVYETDAERDVAVLPRAMLPARAVVLALSPLLDQRTITALLDLQGSGADLTIIELPVAAATASDEVGRLAQRIWTLQRRAVRAMCASAGVPVIQWDDHVPLTAAIEQAREWRRQPAPRHV
jgi:uncharacterized protein (DUF58 family)